MGTSKSNGLSRRVQDALKPNPIIEAAKRALLNPYDQTKNPNGVISLGIAENTLMYDQLANFLAKNVKATPDLLGYLAIFMPPPSLISGLLRLYNSSTFSPVKQVEFPQIYFSAGSSAVLDQLFWSLCDEGDGVLVGMPLYGGFANDMQARGRVKLLTVSLKGYDAFSKNAVPRYEEELLKAEKGGIRVRALLLCQPHNPLGQYLP
jgi:histidinol-phosphate/aromatic aminotransferase/cobyric acid decarboxylase-like protein